MRIIVNVDLDYIVCEVLILFNIVITEFIASAFFRNYTFNM